MIAAQISALKPPGSLFGRHEMMVPPGVTLADLLNPTYWANAAPKLQPNAEIRAVAADGSFDALLAVSAVENRSGQHHWAEMRVLRSWTIAEPEAATPQAS